MTTEPTNDELLAVAQQALESCVKAYLLLWHQSLSAEQAAQVLDWVKVKGLRLGLHVVATGAVQTIEVTLLDARDGIEVLARGTFAPPAHAQH